MGAAGGHPTQVEGSRMETSFTMRNHRSLHGLPRLGSQLECNFSFNYHHFEAAELEVWVCQYCSPKIAQWSSGSSSSHCKSKCPWFSLIQGTWTSHPDAIGSALAPKYQQVPGSKKKPGQHHLIWLNLPSLTSHRLAPPSRSQAEIPSIGRQWDSDLHPTQYCRLRDW